MIAVYFVEFMGAVGSAVHILDPDGRSTVCGKYQFYSRSWRVRGHHHYPIRNERRARLTGMRPDCGSCIARVRDHADPALGRGTLVVPYTGLVLHVIKKFPKTFCGRNALGWREVPKETPLRNMTCFYCMAHQ